MRSPALLWSVVSLGVVAACGGGEPSSGGGGGGKTGDGLEIPIPADAQRQGDPAKGYDALVNEGYVSCGVPETAFAQVFGAAPANYLLPGRNSKNEKLPYNFTRFTTTGGVDVVSANCLQCHAGFVRGKLIVGLGDTQGDYTSNDQGSQAGLAAILLTDQKEKDELALFKSRLDAIGDYTVTKVAGVNPADNLAAVLFAHRDRKTLAWSDEPLLELPPKDVTPVDVPPWWRMKKKHAMFYVAAGRGDHARIEMTASTLCTDTVAEAKAIDAYFPDIEAYIASVQPPAYDGPVDQALAAKGKTVFEETCSRCHGTYGDHESYPNLLVKLEEIGTDDLLAAGSTQFAEIYVDWFNDSFYGEEGRLDPQRGYVAPPLDGIWATAPYLHNGSVPTIAALLDSGKRPKYWSRKYDSEGRYDSHDYDDAALGWKYTEPDHGQADEPNSVRRTHLYDTTLPGYGNQGHTFGDSLSPSERSAVIEYLKTL